MHDDLRCAYKRRKRVWIFYFRSYSPNHILIYGDGSCHFVSSCSGASNLWVFFFSVSSLWSASRAINRTNVGA